MPKRKLRNGSFNTPPLPTVSGPATFAAGVARIYDGLIDGLIADEPGATLVTDTLMDGAGGRRRVAKAALDHAFSLRR